MISASRYTSLLKTANPAEPIVLRSYFGRTEDARYHDLAHEAVRDLPLPDPGNSPAPPQALGNRQPETAVAAQLSEDQADHFATALDEFSRKVWRKPKEQKAARYDLAILCDPEEAMPPSDKGALKRFIRAGKELGIDCEVIRQRDLPAPARVRWPVHPHHHQHRSLHLPLRQKSRERGPGRYR